MAPAADEQTPKFLVSAQSAIDEQLAKIEKTKVEWCKSFPGRHATHLHKVGWLAKMEAAHRDDPGDQKLFDPNDVLKLILRESAAEPVEVQLVVKEDKLAEFGVASLGPSDVYGETTKSNGTVSAKEVIDVEKVKEEKTVKEKEKAPSTTVADKSTDGPDKPSAVENPTAATAADIVASAGADGGDEMRIDEPPALVIEKPSAADSMQDVAAEAGKPVGNDATGNTAPEPANAATESKAEVKDAMEGVINASDVAMKDVTADKKPCVEPPAASVAPKAEVEKKPVVADASAAKDKTPQTTEAPTGETSGTAPAQPSEPEPPAGETTKEASVKSPEAPAGETSAAPSSKPSEDPKGETPGNSTGGTSEAQVAEASKAPTAEPAVGPAAESGATEQATRQKPSLVVIARKSVDHNTRTDVIVQELLRSVGLPIDATVRSVPACDGTNSQYNQNISDFIVEMVSVPLASGGSAVAIEVVSKESRLSSFERSIFERTFSGKENAQSYMMVKKDASSPDNAGPTPETHDVLWYSRRLENERCTRHLRDGVGEVDAFRKRLKNGGVDSANLKLQMVQAELNYVKRISGENRWMTKLSALLAMAVEINRAPEFISTCDKPEEAVKTIIEMAEYWRNSILKHGGHTDVQLGINPPGETDGTQSRNMLCTLLKQIQGKLESIELDQKAEGTSLKVFFSAVPGKPRVRSPTAAGATAAPAATNPSAPGVTPAPRGRCPHDSAGVPMTWDGVNALWRSSTNPAETRVPRVRTPKGNNVQATATLIAPLALQPVGATIQAPPVSDIAPAAVDGKQDDSISKQSPALLPEIAPANVNANSGSAAAAPVAKQNSNPAKGKRPGGRPPHDSGGQTMVWDPSAGVWRSAANPNETKVPKTPKKQQVQIAPAGPAPTKTPTPPQPMEVDVPPGKPAQSKPAAEPSQASGHTPAANSNIAPSSENAVESSPRRSMNTVVPMTPFSIDPMSHSRHKQSQTPRKRSASEAATGSSAMFTPPPRGRAPLDSNGESMNRDGSAGLWRSTRNPSETKVSRAVLSRKASPGAERTPKAARADPPKATPMEIASAEPATTAAVPPASSPVSSEGQQYARPGGRPPNDSTGRSMNWDFSVGVWRSAHIEGEIKQPKTAPKVARSTTKASTETAAPETEVAAAGSEPEAAVAEPKSEEMDIAKEEENATPTEKKEDTPTKLKATMTLRPGGRAPNDSTGTSMVWDGVQAVWRSLNNPEEIRKPNVSVWKYAGGPVVDGNDIPLQVNEQAEEESPVKAAETPKKSEEAKEEIVPTTPRPRGKPPNDSKGQVMQWDAMYGRWFSTHIEGEYRTPKAKTPAKAAEPKAEAPAETEVEKKVEAEAQPEEAPQANSQSDAQPIAGEGKQEEEAQQAAQAPAAVEPTMRPKGRAPHDSAGKPMVWDVGHHCWRSTVNLSETKPPKTEVGGGSGEGQGATSTTTPVAAGASSKGVSRPKGRAPYDTKGAPMNWDSQVGVWKSIHDPNEIKTPKKVSG